MEGNSTPTPDAQLEPAAGGTPPTTPAVAAAEPVAPPAPELGADQSAAEPDALIAQAEYTRSQQTIAAIRQELGLDRKATREQVIEAVRQRAAAVADPDAPKQEAIDPRLAAAEERAFVAELRVQEAVYAPLFGQGFTARALELTNTLRQTNDPEDMMGAIAAFIEGSRPVTAAATSEPPAPGDGAPAAAPPDIGLPEGDQGPSARPVPTAGRRESGVVGAIRGIFAEAGASNAR